MAHPFAKLFEASLSKSTTHQNLVLKKAQEFINKGYRREEVCEVLEKVARGRIDDTETRIVREAIEAISDDEEEDF
jgi:hypothetical protein